MKKILQAWKGARFVGFFASFPISHRSRKTEILTEVLNLEKSLTFNELKIGRLSRGVRKGRFEESKLSQYLESLQTGDADWLQLYSVRSDSDWVREQETQVHLSWRSSIIELTSRPPSPVDQRFGNVGSITVTYPLSRFQVDSESTFQAELANLVKSLIPRYKLDWAFVHEGFRPKRPASVGEDDVFQETRDKFPLTSFDSDLHIALFFKEFVKGAFWANFLNPFHVERLGGIQHIKKECPASMIAEIGDGHVLLEVGPSPLPRDYERAVHDYQAFRKFLGPILMETPEERTKFQIEALGSWRPPGYDANWKPISPSTHDR